MAITKFKKYPKAYEYIVVGTDLVAKLIAVDLHRRGFQTLLLESYDSASMFSSQFSEDAYYFDRLGVLEDDPEMSQLIDRTNSIFGEPSLNAFSMEFQLKTFEGGSEKQFLGFGQRNYESINEYQRYTSSKGFAFTRPIEEFLSQVSAAYLGDRLVKAKMTGIEFNEGSPQEIIVNGNIKISTDNLVLALTPSKILDLLPEALLPGRLRQKLAKTKMFSTLQLTVSHDDFEAPGSEDLYFLMGGQPTDEATIGRFFKNEDTSLSRWIHFISPEMSSDYGFVGNQLKYLKRQIKRIFPELVDNPHHIEKINLFSESQGFVELNEKDMDSLRSFNHLFLTSPYFYPNVGLGSQLKAFFEVYNRFDPNFVSPLKTPEDMMEKQ